MSPAGDLATALHRLAEDTRIVQERTRFIGNAEGIPKRWRLNDNTTLFQLVLAPDMFIPDYRAAQLKPLAIENMIQALQELEGAALEHLTSDWLMGHPHVQESYAGAKAPAPKCQDLGDIDVLARCKQDEDRWSPRDLLLLVNAKRNSQEHDIGAFEQTIRRFMAQGTAPENDPDQVIRQEIRELRDLPHTLLFVSPVFEPADRDRIQAAGHLPLALNDMIVERRADWPLLQERLERARQAEPGQEIRLVQKSRPRTKPMTSLPEPKAATDRSKTELEEPKTPDAPQAEASKDKIQTETVLPKP